MSHHSHSGDCKDLPLTRVGRRVQQLCGQTNQLAAGLSLIGKSCRRGDGLDGL